MLRRVPQVTGAVGWRKDNIKYKKNEVFLDIVEQVCSCAGTSSEQHPVQVGHNTEQLLRWVVWRSVTQLPRASSLSCVAHLAAVVQYLSYWGLLPETAGQQPAVWG